MSKPYVSSLGGMGADWEARRPRLVLLLLLVLPLTPRSSSSSSSFPSASERGLGGGG